jgi:hypothetical protein
MRTCGLSVLAAATSGLSRYLSMWDHSQMKDDDPEKRIRELERELADMSRPPQSTPPYTGDASPYTSETPPPAVDSPFTANPYDANAPYAANQSFTSDAPPQYSANPPYAGNAPYVRDPTWGVDFRPPRRRSPYAWVIVFVALGILLPTIFSVVAHFASNRSRSSFGPGSGATASNGPTAVPQGGELRVGGTMEGRTIACNDGKLTLYGTSTDYFVTGHCASLAVGGYHNKVTVQSADTLESTGFSNTVTLNACNNGNLTLSSYGMTFNVTGNCASLAISSYDNKVTVDSVDAVNISGDHNVVTYHTGKPTVTDSGYSNKIQKG